MDELEAAEAAYAQALDAYQTDPTPELKAAYRAASQALTAVRTARRGSTVVTPQAVEVAAVAQLEG